MLLKDVKFLLFFFIQEVKNLQTYFSLKSSSHILLLCKKKKNIYISANPSISKYLSQFREQELSTYQSITFQHNFKRENEGATFRGPRGTRGINLKHRVAPPLLGK